VELNQTIKLKLFLDSWLFHDIIVYIKYRKRELTLSRWQIKMDKEELRKTSDKSTLQMVTKQWEKQKFIRGKGKSI
jgi:hypothetical protein